MGFLDIFRKNSKESDNTLKLEIHALKNDFANLNEKVNVLDKNISHAYFLIKKMERIHTANVSINAQNTGNTNTAPTMAENTALIASKAQLEELKQKIKEMYVFARLSIQNHDELNGLKEKMVSLQNAKEEGRKNEEDPPATHQNSQKLTSKENAIVSALLNCEAPIGYEDIAKAVNMSPITVKGYLNAIKRKYPGIIVETLSGRRKKVYSLKAQYKFNILGGT